MISKRTWQALTSVACALIVGYFLYRTIEGDHGWLAMLRLQNKVNEAQQNLSQLQQEDKALSHRVHLMRPGSLDPDLLDEKSRETLDYSKPNDIIVLTPPDGTAMPQPDVVQRSK